jgi:hypothetical protein
MLRLAMTRTQLPSRLSGNPVFPASLAAVGEGSKVFLCGEIDPWAGERVYSGSEMVSAKQTGRGRGGQWAVRSEHEGR